jgi:hypothetical protein
MARLLDYLMDDSPTALPLYSLAQQLEGSMSNGRGLDGLTAL